LKAGNRFAGRGGFEGSKAVPASPTDEDMEGEAFGNVKGKALGSESLST
jgi:hypothetical protein